MYGKAVDRPPCVPLIDLSYAAAVADIDVSQCFLNPAKQSNIHISLYYIESSEDIFTVKLSSI